MADESCIKGCVMSNKHSVSHKFEKFRKYGINGLGIRNHFGAAATYTMLKRGKIDRTMYINAIDPAKANGIGCRGRLLRSFMHSKLATYRY